ncbi:MAG: hypothetical protein ACNS62_17460 [Candidatus Cyclobacteriaceae bacterium M3_2C_046]
MKNANLKIALYLLIVSFLIQTGCTKDDCIENPCASGCPEYPCPDPCDDPCANPDLCPGECGIGADGSLTKAEFQGDLQQQEEGHYNVEGELEINLSQTDKLLLTNSDLRLEFDEQGNLLNISGKATIPSPTNHIEFEDLVRADVGYFNGRYLNENRDFPILLKDEKFYFVFHISAQLAMKVGANDDPDAVKPLVIKPPVGGHITYIADYSDPMFFFSGGHDLLGSICFAASVEGNLPYRPLQPVDQGEAFDGIAMRCGSYDFFKVISFSGQMIQNATFNYQVVEENPLNRSFEAGYQAGLNGSFDLSLPVVKFTEFTIPLGEASGAVLADGNTASGFKGLIFINGLADPDNSWWPDFIPVKAGSQMRAKGYVHQDGQFEIGLLGEYYLETPANKQSISGESRVNNQEFVLEGTMLMQEQDWTARATFNQDQTEFAAIPPDDLLQGLDQLVSQKIDSTFEEIDAARDKLEEATKNYEFEVSLRGLRESIPVITQEARQQIKKAVDKAVADGRSEANKILKDKGLVLCSDNIRTEVNKVAVPYYQVLDRLDATINKEDSDQARRELEKALRDLASLQTINESIRVRITAGNKAIWPVSACTVKDNFYRTIKINRTVLTGEQVNIINEAANNVQYIPEASDLKIKAREIFDRLPSKEELENLQNDLNTGVKQIPAVSEVGFVNDYAEKTFAYYIIVDKERKEIEAMEFNGSNLAEVILDLLI